MSGPAVPPLLLCFHHAGAGVSAFSRWQAEFGATAEVVPVLLPGRDARVREPRVTELAPLLAELEVAAALTRGRPYLLYGHSLGGLVAYSFAAAREAAGDPPQAVVIGAVLPPHLRSPLALSAELPDTPLLRLLVREGVLPPEAADAERGSDIFRRRVLPPLRDDLRLAQTSSGARPSRCAPRSWPSRAPTTPSPRPPGSRSGSGTRPGTSGCGRSPAATSSYGTGPFPGCCAPNWAGS